MKKIFFFYNELKSTFWFVPVLILAFAIALALLLLNIDYRIDLKQEGIARFLFIGSSDSARNVLSTISAAMIGVAGTVFSVTLVALTLASSQFGPRLIKNFMYVRLNQVVLGSYISTYIYCLIILNTIKESDSYTYVPSYSILVALLAAVANIILLIVFIHRIATSIQADHVISDISSSISSNVEALFPSQLGSNSEKVKEEDLKKKKESFTKTTVVHSPKSGYLQYLGGDSLINIAKEMDGVIFLELMPGEHVVKGSEICNIYSNKELDKELKKKIESQFIFGGMRSSQQDMEYSVQQMVEIAVRALSTGVNDPFTAISCIDNLTSTLCRLMEIEFPSNYRLDSEGELRVVTPKIQFEGMLDAAFNQIRQFSAGSPAVIIRMMDGLNTLYEFAETEEEKNSIIKHARMVWNVGKRSIDEDNDRNDLQKRAAIILPDLSRKQL